MDIAKELEAVAQSDDYFIDNNLYPNVGFNSGILLRAIGIRTIMLTVMFAISRLLGWVAQGKERSSLAACQVPFWKSTMDKTLISNQLFSHDGLDSQFKEVINYRPTLIVCFPLQIPKKLEAIANILPKSHY